MSSSVEILEKAGGSLVLGEFARLRRGFSPPRPPCGACSVALIHWIAGFRPSAAGSARLDVVLAEWGGGEACNWVAIWIGIRIVRLSGAAWFALSRF